MTEPRSHAKKVKRITPEVLNWHIIDERIKTRSDAFAVVREGRAVLIDPLPLADEALKSLGKVEAICLTGSSHQRSAWRYRKVLGAKVHAPEGAEGLEEKPDAFYKAGDRPAGGLLAVHAPGPAAAHYALLHESGKGVLFCADVLYREDDAVRFLPDQYQDDPKRSRDSARRFLELRFDTLCFAHGAPLVGGARDALRKTLEADRKRG